MTLAALSAIGSRAMYRYMSRTAVASSKLNAGCVPSRTCRAEGPLMRMLVRCSRQAENVAKVRHAGALVLADWGLGDLAEVAELLISELVTNAVLHAEGDELVFSLVVQGGEVFLQVQDSSACRPHLSEIDLESEGGRGLFLVDRFSDRWGTSEDGTSTWCTLVIPSGVAGAAG